MAGWDARRLAGEVEEDGLRHLLGEVGRAHLPMGGTVDEVDMPGHQRGKGRLRMGAGVDLQPLEVAHVFLLIAAGTGNPTVGWEKR